MVGRCKRSGARKLAAPVARHGVWVVQDCAAAIITWTRQDAEWAWVDKRGSDWIGESDPLPELSRPIGFLDDALQDSGLPPPLHSTGCAPGSTSFIMSSTASITVSTLGLEK